MANTLSEAIALMRAGKKEDAHQIFEALIANDPHNVPAWLWDVGTQPTIESRIECLELCLQYNPGNAQATQALTTLQAQSAKETLLTPRPPMAAPPPPASSKESDFITMQCPNCGGKLAVRSGAVSLKCDYCGMEHMIRREAGGIILEAHARCPVCNRNDRVEKVTAILRSQTQNAQGVTYRNETALVTVGNVVNAVSQQVAVPVQSSQMTDLAKHLILPLQAPSPPPPPPAKTISVDAKTSSLALGGTLVLGAIGALGVIIWLTILVSPDTSWGTLLLCSAFTALPIIAAVAIGVTVLPRELKKNREAVAAAAAQQKTLQEEERQRAETEMRQWNDMVAAQVQRWKTATEDWNRLYYCGRDDCVFVPGKTTSASIVQMVEYLGLQPIDIAQPAAPMANTPPSSSVQVGVVNQAPRVQSVVIPPPVQPAPYVVYRSSKSRGAAIVLALFLGGLGVHKFYLGETIWGILYLIFCWTGIPVLLSLLDCIVLLFMSEGGFARKYP